MAVAAYQPSVRYQHKLFVIALVILLFGIGTLHVETAGLSGQKGAEVSLVGLPDVVTVYDEVAEALRRFRGAMAPTQAEEEPLPAVREVLAAILGELQSIRRLLERA